MTDPATPSSPTAEATDRAPRAAPRRRPQFARERAVVGAVFFLLVGALVVNGAIEIHRDTFRVPPARHPIASCSAEIARLYTAFASLLQPVRERPGVGLVPHRPWADPRTRRALFALDEDLRALRPYCAREGAAALEAHAALSLWRYHAQDLSQLEERTLTPDAERALRYQSPTTALPPPGNAHER